MTTIIFLIVLAVLIFVHELGHFLFAIWNGVRVDEFKIGFGPRIISWGKGETKYGLNLIPFGGYVKIHGENPDDESISGIDKERSFANKKSWQQAIILVAGVLFNFIFAWIIYSVIFFVGVTASPEGFEKYSDSFKNQRVMITTVSTDSPADKAGLKIGDIITGVNQSEQISISDIQNAITNSNGNAISIKYKRNGVDMQVETTPVQGLVNDKYAIGVAMNEAVDVKFPFFGAIYEGGHYTLVMIRETAIGLYDFFTNIFRGEANFSDVSGPVGIAGIVGGAAELGFKYLLMITALISINLGVINLVPFPALDGGRVFIVLIESIIRRRIKPVYVNSVNTVGFVLLMILMVVVTYKDIVKIFK